MTAGRPHLRWAAKTQAAATFCLAGALVGTGLYFGNLSYVTTGDDAARAAAAAQKARIIAEAAAQKAGIPTLSPTAAASPKALPVLDVLRKYFTSVNTRNYAEYLSTLAPDEEAELSKSTFDSGYSTTRYFDEMIKTITITAGGGLTVAVSFTSTQSAADSIDGSLCNHWMVNFYLIPHGEGYVIAPPPTGYQPSYSDCKLSACGAFNYFITTGSGLPSIQGKTY